MKEENEDEIGFTHEEAEDWDRLLFEESSYI